MKEVQNNKINLVLLILGVLALLVTIVGAAYAFFQAQTSQGQTAAVNVATGTTDNLTFTIADIDVTNPKEGEESKNIVDSHNKVLNGVENAELVINADTNNFGPNGTSLGDGVEATARLVANDNTKTAEAKYNVYLVLDQNELEYTVGKENPELILTVHAPGSEEEYTNVVTTLDHHDKDTNNQKDISGYDITGKRAVITIAEDYLINVTESSKDLTEAQTWKIQITFVNYPQKNQNNNSGKKVTGKVIITTEKNIELSNINTLNISRTDTSIMATAVTENSKNIEEYYFKIDGGTPIATIALDNEKDWIKEEQPSHDFGILKKDTEYTISAYGVDNKGFKTNIYETKVSTGEEVLPTINSVIVSETTFNSIKVNVNASEGVTSYEYTINGQDTITNSSNEHTFNKLKKSTNYIIIVVGVKDGIKTPPYVIEAKTAKYETYTDTCDGSTNSCQVAKTLLANAKEGTLFYHDGTITDEEGNVLDAEDNSYRYAGASEVVNNYVCFGGDCSNDPNDDNYVNLYRIIGFFDDNNDSIYNLKIIRADYAIESELGGETIGATSQFAQSRDSYKGNLDYLTKIRSYFWNNVQNNSGSSTNDWEESNLNEINLNQTFLSLIEEPYIGMIEYHEWQVGGNIEDNIRYQNAKNAYSNEIINQFIGTDLQVSPTYRANIGLMYVSDYLYGTLPTYWGEIADNYNQSEVKKNNWLYLGLGEWTITRRSDKEQDRWQAYRVHYAGYIGDNYIYGDTQVRPAMYLNSNVKISSGSGTETDPYKLSV